MTRPTQGLPGDQLIPHANVVMDRAFTLAARPDQVWPWFVQLGKNRAGWYLPRSVERFIAPGRRALRRLDPALLAAAPAVGDRIDDWGGKHAYFELAVNDPPHSLVYTSRRGRVELSWAIALAANDGRTQVRLRLRLAGVRRRWLANSVGDWFDALTVAGLAAGLRERLDETQTTATQRYRRLP
jgi:hypothetical protein